MLKCLSLAVPLLAASPALAEGPAPLAAQDCLGCHGPEGRGLAGGARLAGQDAAALEATLRAFRTGQLPGTIMPRIARGYTEAELAAAAAWFAAVR